MFNTTIEKNNSVKQKKLRALLSVSITGALLNLSAPVQADNEGIPLHGFADAGFTMQSIQSNSPKGFNVGSLDFYLTPKFGDNVKGLVEVIFETTPAGEIATDLERMEMGYTFSDNATVWVGRFHTPYGFWNTGFHHGAQIQTSVMRPRFLDFEDKGGILPAHMAGLMANGKLRMGGGKFTYDVFMGNGPKISMGQDPVNPSAPTIPVLQSLGTLNINTAGDNNHQAMVGFNVGYEFSGAMDGLRFAIHSLRGDVDDDSNATLLTGSAALNKTELNMIGGSLVYLENDWELMTEFYRFNNKDKNILPNPNYGSTASYLQIGKTFGKLTPYLRKEITKLDQLDNYFKMQANGQSYTRHAGGLKYELDPKAAFKIEVQYSDFENEPGRTASKYRSLYAQYAIRF